MRTVLTPMETVMVTAPTSGRGRNYISKRRQYITAPHSGQEENYIPPMVTNNNNGHCASQWPQGELHRPQWKQRRLQRPAVAIMGITAPMMEIMTVRAPPRGYNGNRTPPKVTIINHSVPSGHNENCMDPRCKQ